MLRVIENLLILQDRDRKIMRVEGELANIAPERTAIEAKTKDIQGTLESAKAKVKQLESERKRLELEVESKKQQIEKYSLQQFQTKKNEEYRALAHEIELCKEAISKLEDQQLEFMEQIDSAQKQAQAATTQATQSLKSFDEQKAGLNQKETRLKKELEELKADYGRLQEAVDEGVRDKYLRLRRQRGATTVVGIEHSVCGGCHMKLPTQIVLQCQAPQELVTCPNCGRILYFTRQMDLVAAS